MAGAVDSYLVGEDIGNVCDMAEPLEIPITNDLTMVLGSISQVTNQNGIYVCGYVHSHNTFIVPLMSIGSLKQQQ